MERSTNFRGQAVAVAAGAVLFSLGVREAVRLRDADLVLARSRARQLGATRIVAGLVLLTRPQFLTAALGLSAAGEAGWWLSRMLAVRELAVGTGALAASRSTRLTQRFQQPIGIFEVVHAPPFRQEGCQ